MKKIKDLIKDTLRTVRVSTGLGFVDLLQLMFIYLKLTNQIDWNWGLVLLPFIIAFALCTLGLIAIFVILARVAKHEKQEVEQSLFEEEEEKEEGEVWHNEDSANITR